MPKSFPKLVGGYIGVLEIKNTNFGLGNSSNIPTRATRGIYLKL
jgi:hypothetical protein